MLRLLISFDAAFALSLTAILALSLWLDRMGQGEWLIALLVAGVALVAVNRARVEAGFGFLPVGSDAKVALALAATYLAVMQIHAISFAAGMATAVGGAVGEAVRRLAQAFGI